MAMGHYPALGKGPDSLVPSEGIEPSMRTSLHRVTVCRPTLGHARQMAVHKGFEPLLSDATSRRGLQAPPMHLDERGTVLMYQGPLQAAGS